MMKNLGTLVALLVIAVSASASGAFYSYDFSALGYFEGQVVEGSTLDFATLTSENGNLYYTNAFGGGILNDYNNGATGDTYLNFSTPVDFVSFTGGDGAGDYDAFEIFVYEFGTNNYLGTYATPVFGGINEPEWYTLNVSLANIGRVEFDPGNSGTLPGVMGLLGGVVMNDFAYNTTASTVPKPGMLSMLGLGLSGIALYLRRKK
jgi:hypothetical protein